MGCFQICTVRYCIWFWRGGRDTSPPRLKCVLVVLPYLANTHTHTHSSKGREHSQTHRSVPDALLSSQQYRKSASRSSHYDHKVLHRYHTAPNLHTHHKTVRKLHPKWRLKDPLEYQVGDLILLLFLLLMKLQLLPTRTTTCSRTTTLLPGDPLAGRGPLTLLSLLHRIAT
jgi:hypothetical protein